MTPSPPLPKFSSAKLTLACTGRFALALGWFGDYDGYDVAALSLLAHGPAVSLPMIHPVLPRAGRAKGVGGFAHGSHMAWQGAVH